MSQNFDPLISNIDITRARRIVAVIDITFERLKSVVVVVVYV